MIEIYHVPPSRSVRIIWLLEELGIPHQIHRLTVPVRDKHPEYLELNPSGLLPTVVDDGEILRESMPICDHLARKYGGDHLVRNHGQAGYFPYLEWLFFGESTLSQPLGNIMKYGPHQSVDKQIPQAVSDSLQALKIRLRSLEKRLAQTHYMAGDTFTLADISVGYPIWLCQAFFQVGHELGPSTTSYLMRLLEREALLTALAK